MSLDPGTLNILSNQISALNLEIACIKGRVQRIKAKNGILLESIGNIYIYKFSVDDRYEVPDDTDVLIIIGNSSHKALIINFRGLELIFSCEYNLGQKVPLITIHISNANLLESLKKLLEQVQAGTLPINEDIILKLFSVRQPGIIPFGDFLIPSLPFTLDQYQLQAIKKSLNSDISFIWFAGTGKTAIIAVLVQILIESGLSVLIVSNTNVAVDNAFEKFIQFFRQISSPLANGEIIRYGNIQVESIKDLVQESNIISRLAAPLYSKISELNKSVDILTEEKTRLADNIKIFKEYESYKTQGSQNQKYIIDLRNKLSANNHKLKLANEALLKNQNILVQLEVELNVSLTTNAIIRFLKGIQSPKQINIFSSNIQHKINSLLVEKYKLNNSIQTGQSQLNKLLLNQDRIDSDIVKIENNIPE